jgi:hypothetical protein
MSWQDILKEFKPDTTKGEYFQIFELLDYIIATYPDRAENAEKVKKDYEKIIDTYYETRNSNDDNTVNQLNNLSQYITRGKSKTLRDTWDNLITALLESL